MGADVTDLSDADLGSDTALAAFDTVVVGIFAMRFRAGLLEAMPRLHRWTEAGGTLVTLYHRPGTTGTRTACRPGGSRSASPRCAGG
jgi:hypothetical protein